MLVVVLVLALVLGRVLSPMFLSSANLSNMLADFTEIALIALPMTLIIVAAEIDLSVASVLGASSALMGVLWHMGLPMPLVIAIVHGCRDACRPVQRARDRALQSCPRLPSPSAPWRCFAAWRTCCSAIRLSPISRRPTQRSAWIRSPLSCPCRSCS